MAIGARHLDVIGMVVGGGMKLALAGTVIGLSAALVLSQMIRWCSVCARRATRVDPIDALRNA